MDITCFRLHQLEAITNNFSEDHKVGSGGYGDVYKAVHNGEQIAVKKFHLLQELGDEDFRHELRNLNKVHHKNSIKLIGYCYEAHHRCVEYNGDLVFGATKERFLCLEYMQGGSLDKHIKHESCILDWPTCYKIIQGTCEGLNHLHNAHEKPIFHLDLNPSIILLDKDMTPKIAGFGLSTLASTEEEWQTKKMRGTIGYMPPEYIERRIVSNKFDVFSLGVIILKMMAGDEAYFRCDEMSPGHFIELVSENWKGMFQTTPKYQSHDIDILGVRTCVEIALRCVDWDRRKRPSIENVVCELEELEAKIERIMLLPPDESKDLILERGSNPHHLPLQQLKDITSNFCHERIIGRGGFGVVYKGVLQNGKMVAVKKIMQAMSSSVQQFENEVNLLMKLKHPNIVRLVGYCYEMRNVHMPHEGKSIFASNIESLLCLEYLPTSLDKCIKDASSGLDWHTRRKIIEGISYGLQYLHEQCNEPIIHLDLKPANVLLDGNMRPKITDFGVSRLFDQTQTIHIAATNGTLGYMPPEFLYGITTPMSDIFSLGAIIMEVIMGRRVYPDDIRKSSKDFIELEVQKWRNRLQKELRHTSLEADCHHIERCIQIGLICLNPERTKRPTIQKVIDMLQGLGNMNWYMRNELSKHDIFEEP